MNVAFLNPFVEAAYEVLRAEVGVEARRGELGLDKNAYVTADVTVLISLVGQVQGIVSISLEEAAALAFAAQMLGEALPGFNGLAQSGIAELGNVITGRASVKLAEAGFASNISPPTLLLGKGATISTLDFIRLIVPLHTGLGTLTIHLALREGVARTSAASIPVPARPAITA
jgi:chemotaxis protein CheX